MEQGRPLAYWDMYGRPETKPKYDRGVPATWWYEEDKAAKLTAKVSAAEESAESPSSRSPFVMLALVLAILVAGYFHP